MTYIDGFVAAVPTANEAAYLAHATAAAALFRGYGATRCVECWGDDVKDGHTTDFRRAVQAKEDETVVFAWIEYPDRPTRDAAMAKIMADPTMAAMAMPFDGRRMVFGGFRGIVEERPTGAKGGYIDGFLVPVPPTSEKAYVDMALAGYPIFRDHGIVAFVESWGDDVPAGKVTDFFRAVAAEGDETVVFSWIEWPDRAARDLGNDGFMADERMKDMPAQAPFDGRRMVYGGFRVILDA